MKQRYHTIIKPRPNGWFVGWVEEVPGTISQGRDLDECRRNLKEALALVVRCHREEARAALDGSCILESIEIDAADLSPASARRAAAEDFASPQPVA